MDNALKEQTLKLYCCAGCYGELVAQPDPVERYIVLCPNCGPGRGFVKKTYAAKRQSDSIGELWDVRKTLEDLGILENPHKGKTAQQLLDELGF